ncbi:MAG: translation initiation factor IF-2 [Cellulosilyticum sp.]|nr:translation initiation factor IF-2 [Cellulosilyticum sp.]MEE1071079.1 translation initiation factor IF-2 [Cellulosilyticum sp.]
MSKVRVYEVAKQLNISTKEIMDKLKEYGFEIHSHMSTLEDEEAKLIIGYYQEVNQSVNIEENTTEHLMTQTEEVPVEEQKKTVGQQIVKPIDVLSNITDTQALTKSGEQTPKKNKNKKQKKQKGIKETKPMNNQTTRDEVIEDIKVIQLPPTVSIKDFAGLLNVAPTEIIKTLMKRGTIANINQEIDYELASELAETYDVLVEPEEEKDVMEEVFGEVIDDEKDLEKRPPVVVVMGHVDHGKTSLLDAIRSTHVTTGEAGGITQHIGASSISLNGQKITFLDTPGHEAFTAMRMRGAQVTDIAILVVAADDGVMPQTIEAINHAKAANVQIIVAMNKIDKPSANPDRVKQELADQGLIVEDWGGDIICVPVSALKHEGIDNLLEMVLLVAEMSDLKANPRRKARGTIIEAQLDKGRGPVATVLVQSGTLQVGDPIVAGSAYGRVRAMVDSKGKQVKKATPSTPVEILGLSEVPTGGDMFYVANSDKQARQVAERIKAQGRIQMIGQTPNKVSLDDLFSQIQEGKMKDLNIIIKADVQGSVEAVRQSLEKLSNEEVRIRTIHGGVGTITESDVQLASASGAIIIGFNVRPEASTKAMADREEVDIRLYRVIYNAIDDIKAAMKGMLDPEFVEKVVGHAEIRQTFKVSGLGTIGGAYVTDGKMVRNAGVRIVRDGIVVYEGNLASLKRFKDDAKEVATNYECGVMFEKFNDIKEGDVVEAFIMEEVPR